MAAISYSIALSRIAPSDWGLKPQRSRGGVPRIGRSSRIRSSRPWRSVYAMAQDRQQAAAVEEKLGIRVEREPSDARLKELGVRSWPKWGCSPSKFPWTYDARETCYLLEGKVKVFPQGSQDEFVEIGAGDLVVFPKGMSCTWEVAAAVDKHYIFD